VNDVREYEMICDAKRKLRLLPEMSIVMTRKDGGKLIFKKQYHRYQRGGQTRTGRKRLKKFDESRTISSFNEKPVGNRKERRTIVSCAA